jgi:hypothetical protein
MRVVVVFEAYASFLLRFVSGVLEFYIQPNTTYESSSVFIAFKPV